MFAKLAVSFNPLLSLVVREDNYLNINVTGVHRMGDVA